MRVMCTFMAHLFRLYTAEITSMTSPEYYHHNLTTCSGSVLWNHINVITIITCNVPMLCVYPLPYIISVKRVIFILYVWLGCGRANQWELTVCSKNAIWVQHSNNSKLWNLIYTYEYICWDKLHEPFATNTVVFMYYDFLSRHCIRECRNCS